MIGLGLSFKNSGLNLDCAKWQSTYLCNIKESRLQSDV